MKLPRLGPAPTRDTLWPCITTNLAAPGFGSLLGGRRIGYAQAVLMLAGLGLSMVEGLRFISWFFHHWSALQNPEADPLETLLTVWQHVRWSLLGIGLFVLAVLWAGVTSFSLWWHAQKANLPPVVPKNTPDREEM